MKSRVYQTIKTNNLIQKNDHILVGLSGGMDSVFLLHMLIGLKDTLGIEISTAHLNHLVRGEYADRDQNFVKNLSKKLKLDFYTDNQDMEQYAKTHKISDEDAGRILRREFFKKTMNRSGANKVALGHNQDDQVETILMRILRGTGLDGLTGIQYKTDFIIRPILDIKRKYIEEYISTNKLEYVDDHTNYENIYHRNKIRNVLLPTLAEYNPDVDTALLNLGELSRRDNDYLQKITEEKYQNCREFKNGSVTLDINKLKDMDISIQTRVLRKTFVDLKGSTKDISYRQTMEMVDILSSPSGTFIDNVAGYRVRRSFDNLIIEPKSQIQKKDLFHPLKMGINNIYGRKLNVYKSTKPTKIGVSIVESELEGNLVIRNRRPGDRIKLPGMKGRKRLKDLFIEQKIDQSLRDDYLIIADQEKIYWILDLRKAEHRTGKSYINIEPIGDEHA